MCGMCGCNDNRFAKSQTLGDLAKHPSVQGSFVRTFLTMEIRKVRRAVARMTPERKLEFVTRFPSLMLTEFGTVVPKIPSMIEFKDIYPSTDEILSYIKSGRTGPEQGAP